KVRREQPASGPASRAASTRPATSWRIALASGRCIPGCPFAGFGPACLQRTPELGLPPRAVHDLALELSAGSVDVVAARAPHRRDHAGVVELLLEGADRVFARALETGARERVERYEVDLGRVLHLHA